MNATDNLLLNINVYHACCGKYIYKLGFHFRSEKFSMVEWYMFNGSVFVAETI